MTDDANVKRKHYGEPLKGEPVYEEWDEPRRVKSTPCKIVITLHACPKCREPWPHSNVCDACRKELIV